MAQVFVSHATGDRDAVQRRIVEPLEAAGWATWFSHDAIHGAQEWERRIRHGLENSELFLVALTPASVVSPWVRTEVHWAMNARPGRVVPVLLEACDPADCHLQLLRLQYVDLRRDDADARARLLAALEGAREGGDGTSSGTPAAGRAPAGRPRRRRRGAGVALALLLLAAAVAGFLLLRPDPPPPVATSPVLVATTLAAQAPVSEALAGILPPDRRLAYAQTWEGDDLRIAPRLPYAIRQRAGETVEGIPLSGPSFAWDFPALAIKVLNRSEAPVMLVEAVVDVLTSEVDTSPLLVVGRDTPGRLVFLNEGWGAIEDPVVVLRITSHDPESDEAAFQVPEHRVEVETFEDVLIVPLDGKIPARLANEPTVLVRGALEHGPADARRTLPFRTRVALDFRAGRPVPPSATYDLALQAGEAPARHVVPIAHAVEPGGADQFLLRLGSDRSARYRLALSYRRADGTLLEGNAVEATVLVPRSLAGRARADRTGEDEGTGR